MPATGEDFKLYLDPSGEKYENIMSRNSRQFSYHNIYYGTEF
jgi:hypothetical protein